MELDADAVAVGAGMVAVGQAPDVVDAQDGEDVVEAHSGFHVGLVAHGLAGGVAGEQKEAAVEGDARFCVSTALGLFLSLRLPQMPRRVNTSRRRSFLMSGSRFIRMPLPQ